MNHSDATEKVKAGHLRKLKVRMGRHYYLIKFHEIDFIEAEGNYTRICVNGSTYLSSKHINKIEAVLKPHGFIRINSSTIIHSDRIHQLQVLNDYHYRVILDNGQSWIWGKHYRKNLTRLIREEMIIPV